MIMTAVTGNIAEAVGPYTSAATEALDLGFRRRSTVCCDSDHWAGCWRSSCL